MIMTKQSKSLPWISALALSAGMLSLSLPARASSHREAPAISNDPSADNTDVWAWVSPGSHDTLHVVASYIPLEEPSGGPNFYKFSDDVLYSVHISRGNVSLADVVTYYIRFQTTPPPRVDVADLGKSPGGGKEFFSQISLAAQTYTVTKVVAGAAPVEIAKGVVPAPPRIGPQTQKVLHSLFPSIPVNYDDTYADSFIKDMGAEGKVWAGPRDDGFYADLGGIFDLANLRAKGVAADGLYHYNVHTIALDIPTAKLTASGAAPTAGASDAQTIGVWCAASRKKVAILRKDGSTGYFGPWVQVSRLGLPLFNEAIIGLQDKDKYNRTVPATDVANFAAYILNPIIVRDAAAVGIYSATQLNGNPGYNTDPTPFKSGRLDIIDVINLKASGHSIPLSATGDVLRVDLGTDSSFPNGRSLIGPNPNQEQADVTDVLLSVLLTKGTAKVADNVDYNDTNYHVQGIPWLALPWQGFDQGHGKPTP